MPVTLDQPRIVGSLAARLVSCSKYRRVKPLGGLHGHQLVAVDHSPAAPTNRVDNRNTRYRSGGAGANCGDNRLKQRRSSERSSAVVHQNNVRVGWHGRQPTAHRCRARIAARHYLKARPVGDRPGKAVDRFSRYNHHYAVRNRGCSIERMVDNPLATKVRQVLRAAKSRAGSGRNNDGPHTHRQWILLRPLAQVLQVSPTMIGAMVDTSLLLETSLFADLDDELLAPIIAAASDQSLRRGDVIFEENQEPDALYVVTDGRIAIANRSIDGRESVVALMERGDLFGEMPLFDGIGRSADARALERSGVIMIPYAPVRALYEENPSLLWRVVAMLAGRLRNMDEALADSVFLDVTGRTAKRLLELAGDADEFTMPVTQEELAGMVGASRERVNKAIASFVKLGWIEQVDRRYVITNRKQLTIRAR